MPQELLQQIVDAKSLAELWRSALTYFRSERFDAVAYFVQVGPGGSPADDIRIIHSGFSQKIQDVYMTMGLGHYDPIPALALSLGVPIRWTEVGDRLDNDPGYNRYCETMRELEIGDGYTFPLFGPAGRDAALAVGRAVSEQALEQANVERMHLYAQAAHTRICALTPDWREFNKLLSAREVEVLGWVARGKSNGVIADILSISSGTVDTHLRRIYGKLNVADRTSAAVRGVGMGLISAS